MDKPQTALQSQLSTVSGYSRAHADPTTNSFAKT